MNLDNLTSVLNDDVPISALSLSDKIISRINEQCPDISERFSLADTGETIREKLDCLPEPVLLCILSRNVVNVLETQVVIHDVTMYRKSLSYVLAKKEKLPKLVLSFLLFFLFIIVTFEVAHYVFVLKSNGEHVEGYVYKTLLFIFKLLKPLFL